VNKFSSSSRTELVSIIIIIIHVFTIHTNGYILLCYRGIDLMFVFYCVTKGLPYAGNTPMLIFLQRDCPNVYSLLYYKGLALMSVFYCIT